MYILVLLLISTLFSPVISHRCVHDEYVLGHSHETLYTKSEQVYASNLARASTTTQNSTSHQIRILLDTSSLDSDPGYSCFNKGDVIDINGESFTCGSDDVLTSEKKAFLRDVLLPASNARLSSIFRVNPINGPLYLLDFRCGFQGGVAIPTDYTSAGTGLPNTDLVVFVTSRPISTAHVLAFGGQCQEDQRGRPIAGHLNFSPSRIDVNPKARDGQLGIILHELTHVMGFSQGKFSRRGMYTTTTSNALAHNQTEKITVVNTPRVLEFIKKHFGCDSLVGAQLEDGGGDGTRLSHWEKRTFMNEYMTGEATPNPVVSGLTMAVFEDSGWYEIDYSTAEDLVWGQNEGCDFVQKSCGQWPQERGYYCSNDNAVSCSFDLQAKGHCGITKYTNDLPAGSQYFSSTVLGGPSQLADYCPYTIASTNGWCFDSANADIPSLVNNGEQFCKNCRCFESSLVKGLPIGGDSRLACYQTSCVNATTLKVRVGTLWYDCPPETTISVESYGGRITCPKAAQVNAVCADVSPDSAWPTILSVTPSSGSPGTQVIIRGTGFTPNTMVSIHSRCDVTFISSNELAVIVPSPDDENPAHIIAEVVNVIVEDEQGRSIAMLGAFTLHGTGTSAAAFLVLLIEWGMKNWLVAFAVVACVAAALTYYYKRYRAKMLAQKHAYALIQMEPVDVDV